MKEVVISLSDSEAVLHSPAGMEKVASVGFCETESAAGIAAKLWEGFGSSIRRKKLVVAANSRKTIIRIANANDFGIRRGLFGMKLGSEEAWDIIKAVFPIGSAINEDTHIFDISLFGGNVLACFGLLADVCSRMSGIGAELAGVHRLCRLETIEHLLFRKICRDCERAKSNRVALFHQDSGLRVLAVKDGLPEGAFYISNHPTRREEELERILDSLGGKREITIMGDAKEHDDNWLVKFEGR